MSDRPEKTCASCGRRIEWRRRWTESWDQVRWCSTACRRRKVNHADRELERTIVELLSHRSRGASICPSEAARLVGEENWRVFMEPARRAARRLVAAGTVEMTQRGSVVDPSTAKGPVRLRLSPSAA